MSTTPTRPERPVRATRSGPVDPDEPPGRAARRSGSFSPARTWGLWLLTGLAFPVGGLPAIALGGVADVPRALAGGAAAGLLIGAAQWLVLRRVLGTGVAWVPVSAAGLALGLAAGSWAVGYGTDAADLLIQGALSGLGIGAGQALLLRRGVGFARAAIWLGATTVLWPIGWQVTRAVGVSVEDQFSVFGATGALVWVLLSGAVLVALVRGRVGPVTSAR